MPGVTLRREPRALHVRSLAPLAVLSSAVVGGELAGTWHVLNMQSPGKAHGALGMRLAYALADPAATARIIYRARDG